MSTDSGDDSHRTSTGAAPAAPEGLAPSAAGGPSDGPPRERRFRTFDSLIDVPAFRWYILAMTGNWGALQMQQVARGFLAYEITGSFAALGFLELANSMPRVVLALYGGVLADRLSRRAIIQTGQALVAIFAAVIAVLLFTDHLKFEHLIFATIAQGIVNSFVLPARQSMIPEIVGVNRVMNAFALNVFVLNVVRLAAPALAGVLIAVAGPSWVFALMAVMNVLAVIALFPVPITNARTRAALANGGSTEAPAAPAKKDRAGLRAMAETLAYLKTDRVLIWLLLIHGFSSTLSLPYQRLLPGFVREVLSTDADQAAVRIGVLLTMTAVGALVGSLLIASLPSRRQGKLLIASMAIFGVALMAFSASEVLWLSMAIVLVLGVGQAGRQSLVNIMIQTRVSDAYRGRVSSIMLLDDGVESLGIFGIALLAELVGPQWALG
ncbi:MAG: MFS transporter, partial [Dehalococcoidia bacterium]|nr:MFS transporter [Dehalococcoidia bacterium]